MVAVPAMLAAAATGHTLHNISNGDAVHLYSHLATTAGYPTPQIICYSARPSLCPVSMVCRRRPDAEAGPTRARWWCATVRQVDTLCDVRGRIECEWHDAAHTLAYNNTCRWIGITPCRTARAPHQPWFEDALVLIPVVMMVYLVLVPKQEN